ncbi:hypothetical protein [Streptomyces hygroscopicus]|uniref:hypothetical protein n=1 Tax=Streptomyces hygroscopicus TaxID=1912 RepID=UPI0036830A94
MTDQPPPAPTASRTALTHVRVFDGDRLTEPRTVVIDGAAISAETSTHGAQVIDGHGMVLLPGLIDAHVHLHGPGTLEQLCSHGVTTALDMATWPPQLLASLRGAPGVTDIRSAGTPAIGPGGPHARIPGMANDAIVRTHSRPVSSSRHRCPPDPTTSRSWRKPPETAVLTRKR